MSDSPAKLRLQSDARSAALSGDWSGADIPDLSTVTPAGGTGTPAEGSGDFVVDLAGLENWDSRLSAALLVLDRRLQDGQQRLVLRNADPDLEQLMTLARAVPRHHPPASAPAAQLSLRRLRSIAAGIGDGFLDALGFLGATMQALLRTLLGRGAMRRRELFESCFQAGPNALGIIALTSVLVGMILAYLGAAQLQQFGAAVFVADLVAIGMLREMGALMTAVVMSGRTGAAYAAELSTMQANEEIDAIRTLGINPLEFLVAPRVIALVCMMPLLVIFADALGILGGALVAGGMGVTPLQYISQLEQAVSFSHFIVGMGKSLIFAALIALAGCRAGMNAGRNSAAVGKATTDAVVISVVYLIIADAGINILCQQMGY